MRYELSDYEWSVIKPMLPNKPRGVPRVDDRRVLNGIFWVLRSGAPWRDLPENYKPPGTGLKRFLHMDAHRAPATTQNDVAYVDTSSCQRSHQGEVGRPAPSSARYQESC
jgi:transposase